MYATGKVGSNPICDFSAGLSVRVCWRTELMGPGTCFAGLPQTDPVRPGAPYQDMYPHGLLG